LLALVFVYGTIVLVCRDMMMQAWVKTLRPSLINRTKDLIVVLGNEACDLDSGISSISLAYHLKNNGKTNKLVVPMLNIKEQDYPLKTELVFCLESYNIRQEDLIFRDQLDLNKIENLELVLVDHNVLSPCYSDLESCVIEVLDHHEKERKDNEGTKLTIEKVGSCSTLVAEKIFRESPDFSEESVLNLIYRTILIDTVLLSPAAKKVTEKDIVYVEKIESILGSLDRKSIYESVQEAKEKIEHLTPYQLLRRDLKMVHTDKVKISLSAVPTLTQDFLKIENAWKDVSQFMEDESADVVMILGYVIKQGSITRDLMIYTETNEHLYKALVEGLENPQTNLDLVRSTVPGGVTPGVHVVLYNQGNGAASRKVILPSVKKIVKEL